MKLYKILFSLILIAVLLTACTPAVQGLAQLPDEGKTLIMVLLTSALTWLLLQAGKLIPIDLSGYGAPLAAALAPVIIAAIEYYLGMIPSTFDSIVLTVIHLIILLVGSVGAFVITSRVKRRDTKNLLA